MIHLSEILQVLNKHTDLMYDDSTGTSLVIRESEFYTIAKEIINVAKKNAKPNIDEVDGFGFDGGDFYKD
jgi:hypothetical protein